MFDTSRAIVSTLVSVGITAFVILAMYWIIRVLIELWRYRRRLNSEAKSKKS